MNSGPNQFSGAPRSPASGSLGRELHPIDWAIAAGAVDEVWRETQIKVRRRRQRNLQVLAGSLAAAALIGTSLWWAVPSGGKALPDVAPARTGAASVVVFTPEQRQLPDGSSVDIRTGAEVRIHYSRTVRQVVLLRGEAHFQVAKDALRPFVVRAGEVEVRAVGTAFSVQLDPRRVDVLVTEGRVAVQPAAGERPVLPEPDSPPSPRLEPAFVEAGSRVVVARGQPGQAAPPVLEELTAPEIDACLAWRAPRLEFTRTPLKEVLPLIGRHSRVRVGLADAALGEVRLSGVLRADNIETLLRLLEAEHGLRAEWQGTDRVVLHRTP